MNTSAEVSLGDVANYQTGFPFKSRNYSPKGIKLLRGDNIGQGFLRWDGAKFWPEDRAGDMGKFALEVGDVILAMDRPWIEAGLKYATVSAVDLPCLLVQRVARLRRTAKIDGGYLRYLVGSAEFTDHILNVTTGTAVPHISGRDILSFRFHLPSLSEQRNIAAILGVMDDKIELNRKTAATLEEMARALYRSWFVDFDPVRARVEGRAPLHMDAATAALFPDRLGEDGLPLGWAMKRIGEILILNYGKALRKDQRISGRFSVFGSGGSDTTHAIALVANSTIIVGRKGTVGSLRWVPDGCWPIDTVFYVTSRFPMAFILRTLQELPLRDMNTDAAVPGLNRDNVYRLEIPWSGRDIIEAFGKVAGSFQQRIDALAAESRTLTTLRDTLLPRLMSGELRVGAAREMMEEVA